MATCDMGYEHSEGQAVADPEPAPVVVDQGPNEHDVEIAEIEANASIERERIWTEQQELALQAENESLRGELRGIREILDRLQPPEPDPPSEPVVVPMPEPEPVIEDAPPPPEGDKSPTEKSAGGWWDGYR